jgi:hypothetical protein
MYEYERSTATRHVSFVSEKFFYTKCLGKYLKLTVKEKGKAVPVLNKLSTTS